MFNFSRTQLATGGTILALGALTAVAVGAQSDNSASTAQKATPVEVRTVVVHRTVRVTKHRKPKNASAGGSGGGTTSGAAPSYSSGYSSAPKAVPVSTPTYSAPKPAPVQSQTSGYGGSGGSGGGSEGGDGGEHEGGGDD